MPHVPLISFTFRLCQAEHAQTAYAVCAALGTICQLRSRYERDSVSVFPRPIHSTGILYPISVSSLLKEYLEFVTLGVTANVEKGYVSSGEDSSEAIAIPHGFAYGNSTLSSLYVSSWRLS